MSTAPPPIDELGKLQQEISERKKRMKREMESLDRNLDLVKKLKANQEMAARLYESGLGELEKTIFNPGLEPNEESKPSPIPFSNKEKTTMKAGVDSEPKKVKEEVEELKTTNSPFLFSDKGTNYLLNRRCDLKIITYIKNNLNKEDMERFGQSCFGQFLKINELEYQGQLVLHLLLHIDMDASNNEKLVFRINNSEIEFGPREFSQITGLRFGTSDEIITTSSSSIQEKIFHKILVKDIKEAFLSHEGKDESKLKLALLYFLSGTLLASHVDKRIEVQYLHLIEDLEKFNEFLWGRVVYNYLVSCILSLRGRLDQVADKKTTLDLNGFSFALQVWAYEVMPSLAKYCAIRVNNCEDLTPRILRWFTPKKAVSFNALKKFFTPGGEAHLVMKLEEDTTDAIPRPKNGKLLSDKDKKSGAVCSSSAAGDVEIIIIDSDDDYDWVPDRLTKKGSKRGWGATIKMEKRSKLLNLRIQMMGLAQLLRARASVKWLNIVSG